MGRDEGKTRQEAGRFWMALAALLLLFAMVLVVAGVVQFPRQAAHAAASDWPTFLGSNARTGFNSAETALNPATASSLKLQWSKSVPGNISSQPVLADGSAYWGSWDGVEHATDIATGNNLWAVNLGQSSGSCDNATYGVLSSATVSSLTLNGVPTRVVFVGGGHADLYALDAATGATIWHTSLASTPAHFAYSSTALYNGSVYIGMSSLGDCPLSDGGIFQVDAATGQLQNTFHTVPQGCVGASVWGSPAVDEASGKIYFATGNAGKCATPGGLGESIVELNASDLSLVASWHAPSSQVQGDSDFGSTPTLFQATINGVVRSLVGVPNKNGVYYALDRTNLSAGALWQTSVAIAGASPEGGQGSISASAFDGARLYVAGGNTTVQGQSCKGSVQALDPATGSPLVQVCLGAPVLAPVTAVPGLVVVGSGHSIVVINSVNGTRLFTFTDKSATERFWGAASISNGMLLQGTLGGTLFALGVPLTPTPTATITASPSFSPTVAPSTTPGSTLAQDTFMRPDQPLWGNASDGQAWGADANALAAFSIVGQTGQVTSGGTNRYSAILGSSVSDAQVLFSGSLSSFSNASLGAVLRWASANTYYQATLEGTRFTILKQVNGTLTRLSSTGFTAAPATSYTVRFQVVGATLSAKAWPTSASEPAGWTLTTSDSSLTSGYCGLHMFMQSGVTALIAAFQATSQ